MDPLALIGALSALSADTQRDWMIAAAVVVAVMALVLWLEHRLMRAQGKAGSWLVVRVASWVAGPMAALAVVLPARSVSGLEGLAVFYALLFTVAPLIWLGVHLGLGTRLRPALTFGEAVGLSLSGLVVLVLPALALYQALEPLEKAARHLQDNPRNPGPAVPLAHAVQPMLRFNMPTVGDVFSQSLLAPTGLRLERVDERVGERWEDMSGRDHPRYCLNGADLHVFWAAMEGAPHLRLHWVDADGHRAVASHLPDTASAQTASFDTALHHNGFDLAVPVPRNRLSFSISANAADAANYVSLLNVTHGGARHDSCVMPGYRWARGPQDSPVSAVAIRFGLPGSRSRIETFVRAGP